MKDPKRIYNFRNVTFIASELIAVQLIDRSQPMSDAYSTLVLVFRGGAKLKIREKPSDSLETIFEDLRREIIDHSD